MWAVGAREIGGERKMEGPEHVRGKVDSSARRDLKSVKNDAISHHAGYSMQHAVS